MILLGFFWDFNWDFIGILLGFYWDFIGIFFGILLGFYWDFLGFFEIFLVTLGLRFYREKCMGFIYISPEKYNSKKFESPVTITYIVA